MDHSSSLRTEEQWSSWIYLNLPPFKAGAQGQIKRKATPLFFSNLTPLAQGPLLSLEGRSCPLPIQGCTKGTQEAAKTPREKAGQGELLSSQLNSRCPTFGECALLSNSLLSAPRTSCMIRILLSGSMDTAGP